MRYLIITEQSPGRLQAEINAYICEGWIPIGGIAFQAEGNTGIWAQAITVAQPVATVPNCKCGDYQHPMTGAL